MLTSIGFRERNSVELQNKANGIVAVKIIFGKPVERCDGELLKLRRFAAEDFKCLLIAGEQRGNNVKSALAHNTFTIAEDKTLKISFDSANVSVACAASVDQITANSFYNVGDAKVLETDLVAGTY